MFVRPRVTQAVRVGFNKSEVLRNADFLVIQNDCVHEDMYETQTAESAVPQHGRPVQTGGPTRKRILPATFRFPKFEEIFGTKQN